MAIRERKRRGRQKRKWKYDITWARTAEDRKVWNSYREVYI